MSARHEGGCVCGSVRYVTHGDPLRVTVCHCTWCQRRTGSAFSVEPVFNADQVEIGGGPLTKYRHVSDRSGRWLDLEFCPKCGTRSDIFGHGGARLTAEKMGAPFLGEIPLVPRIRETSDAGQPISVSMPDGPEAKAFLDLAKQVAAALETASKPAPKIVIE